MTYTHAEALGIFLLGLSIGFNLGVTVTLAYRAYRLRMFRKHKVPPYNFKNLLKNSIGIALLTMYFFLLVFSPTTIPQELAFMVMTFVGALFGNEFTEALLQIANKKNDKKDSST